MKTKGPLFSRRQFLLSATALGVAGLGYGYFKTWGDKAQEVLFLNKGYIFGPGQGISNNQKTFFLAAVDLNYEAPKVGHIPMNFMGHGLSFHPTKKNLVTIFEKKGPGGCELNLQTGEMRTISTDPSRYFYGHCVYVSDSKTQNNNLKLLATETVLSSGEGVIVVRDAETLKIEGQFPSYGANPHDCLLIENGTVLVITNGGAEFGKSPLPNVAFVDVASQKLIEKFEMENLKFNAGHVAISEDRDLALVSAPRLGLSESDLGAISYLAKSPSGQKQLITLSEPQDIISQLKSETLSVCVDDSQGIFAATSPAGNLLSFWKIKTGEYISSMKLHKPRGVVMTRDKNYFLVSYNEDASLAFINAKTLTLESGFEIKGAGFSGSHLYSL